MFYGSHLKEQLRSLRQSVKVVNQIWLRILLDEIEIIHYQKNW